MNIKQKIKKITSKLKGKKENKTKKERMIDEAKDWAISIAAAMLIYFVILPAILGTSSPLVIVSSCSETPYLNIGNVIVLKGTTTEDIEAPTINIGSNSTYHYNETQETLYINGQKIEKNTSNDIVVYIARPSGSQIIHRALVKLETNQGTMLLTQGDANPIPDQLTRKPIEGKRRLCINQNPGQCISTPVTNETIIGKKYGWRIPILGHVKLFFCDVMPFCEGHSNKGTGYQYKLTC